MERKAPRHSGDLPYRGGRCGWWGDALPWLIHVNIMLCLPCPCSNLSHPTTTSPSSLASHRNSASHFFQTPHFARKVPSSYFVLQMNKLHTAHALCDLSFPGSLVTLSSDTPTILSGFAEVENHSPPTSTFDGMQQHQYRMEVNTFSAVLLLKPSSLTI